MSGELKTQGTELFLLNTDVSPSEVMKVTNLSTVDSVGGTASDIDVTNFDSTAREYLVGLVDNGTASFGFNLNPASDVHEKIFAIRGGGRYEWAIGLSDGTDDPTVNNGTDPESFTLASTRTWFTFRASVQEATPTFQTDDAVRVQGGLRVSGAVTFTKKV